MRISLIALACLAGSAALAPASAEDFTGAYAGVNAGYAFGAGDGHKRGFGTDALGGSGASAADAQALPPSAQDASRALQDRNRSQTGASALPR